jgi:hypothetical protein
MAMAAKREVMMTDSVALCEQEVQGARAKLTADLASLRSPATVTAFTDGLKQEVVAAKDSVIQHTKETVQTTFGGIVSDLKAKAAANPAAALAIGAGIAWQLVRHPPIVSALVGVGLYSLLRTPASESVARGNVDYLDYGKQRLTEQVADFSREAAGVAAEAGKALSDKSAQLYGGVKEKLEDLAQNAAETAATAGSEAKARTDSLGASARRTFHDALDHVEAIATRSTEAAATSLRETVNSAGNGAASAREMTSGSRDSVLLGLAAVAVATAFGIAIQKRIATEARLTQMGD